MKISKLFLIGIALMVFSSLSNSLCAQAKTIHVFVALCDNQYQGIVPVPKALGNGQDPQNNLYWGAMYGMKSYFRYKAEDWILKTVTPSSNPKVLDRVLFKHKTEDCYLLAEAYDGQYIKACTEDFLLASNQQGEVVVNTANQVLKFGGKANLLAYVGHDGLMDFSVSLNYLPLNNLPKEVVVLACISSKYFGPELQEAQATGVVLTTGLMAPEAYTLKAVIDGWLKNETHSQLVERAAQAYNTYQKCGINGARRLFKTLSN